MIMAMKPDMFMKRYMKVKNIIILMNIIKKNEVLNMNVKNIEVNG
jgi:hypothetical protein